MDFWQPCDQLLTAPPPPPILYFALFIDFEKSHLWTDLGYNSICDIPAYDLKPADFEVELPPGRTQDQVCVINTVKLYKYMQKAMHLHL